MHCVAPAFMAASSSDSSGVSDNEDSNKQQQGQGLSQAIRRRINGVSQDKQSKTTPGSYNFLNVVGPGSSSDDDDESGNGTDVRDQAAVKKSKKNSYSSSTIACDAPDNTAKASVDTSESSLKSGVVSCVEIKKFSSSVKSKKRARVIGSEDAVMFASSDEEGTTPIAPPKKRMSAVKHFKDVEDVEKTDDTDHNKNSSPEEQTNSTPGRRKSGRYFIEPPDMKCHACGMDGHIKKDCKQIKCVLCGLIGHIARNCTEQFCNQCGRQGHIGIACKERVAISASVPSALMRREVVHEDLRHVVCLQCCKRGHVNCKETNYSKGAFSASGQCCACAGSHLVEDCPNKRKSMAFLCFNCGVEGHIGAKCPQKRGSKSGGSRGSGGHSRNSGGGYSRNSGGGHSRNSGGQVHFRGKW